MILDCRRVDIKFTTLRTLALLTGEGLSNIEVGEIWDGDWDQHDSCPKLDLLACNPHPVSWPALVRSMAALSLVSKLTSAVRYFPNTSHCRWVSAGPCTSSRTVRHTN